MNRDEHEAWIARQEMEVADKALERAVADVRAQIEGTN